MRSEPPARPSRLWPSDDYDDVDDDDDLRLDILTQASQDDNGGQ